jgi:KUP system potassium uptake protein
LEDRLDITDVADGFYHITVHFGFIETPNLSAALALARDRGCNVDLDAAVWFVARDEIVRAKKGRLLTPWRRVLFAFMYRNAVHNADRFELPVTKFLEIGRQLEL